MIPLPTKGIHTAFRTRQKLLLAGVVAVALGIWGFTQNSASRSVPEYEAFVAAYGQTVGADDTLVVGSRSTAPHACIIATTPAQIYVAERIQRFWSFLSTQFSLVGVLQISPRSDDCPANTNFTFLPLDDPAGAGVEAMLRSLGVDLEEGNRRNTINPLGYGFGYLDDDQPKTVVVINTLSSQTPNSSVATRFVNAVVLQETFQMLTFGPDRPVEFAPTSILHEPVSRPDPDWESYTPEDLAIFLDQTPERLCREDVFALAAFERISAAGVVYESDVNEVVMSAFESIQNKTNEITSDQEWNDIVDPNCSLANPLGPSGTSQ
ncbi:hypothetical protein [Yoonia sp. SS1-5]|uniref:Uncharacterized protein n=1 Tax=Yoonia rhodophyticola TaxID=3137370 RepID=A0AAN0ME84_9RHOB